MHWSRRLVIAFGLLAGIGSGTSTAQPGRGAVSGVYTTLDLDLCTSMESPDGESEIWRCPGYRDIPLFVVHNRGRFDLDAGVDNEVFESPAGNNMLPDRVEWRLRGGNPRAIIYGLRLTDGADVARTIIGVETIGRPSIWAGCLVSWIHGDVRHAAAVARRRANDDYRGFQCGHNEPEEMTRRRPR